MWRRGDVNMAWYRRKGKAKRQRTIESPSHRTVRFQPTKQTNGISRPPLPYSTKTLCARDDTALCLACTLGIEPCREVALEVQARLSPKQRVAHVRRIEVAQPRTEVEAECWVEVIVRHMRRWWWWRRRVVHGRWPRAHHRGRGWRRHRRRVRCRWCWGAYRWRARGTALLRPLTWLLLLLAHRLLLLPANVRGSVLRRPV